MEESILPDIMPYEDNSGMEMPEPEAEKPNGRRVLTTKAAVTLLLEGNLKNNVCRFCLNVDAPLTELDRIIHIAVRGVIYNVTVRTMVASFHPVKVVDDPNFPNKICERCLEQTLDCYLFTQQCEKSERALRNCFEDIYEKTIKLDSLEPTKKRGRAKLNPNYNVIHTEHKNVSDYAEPIIHLVNTNTEIEPNATEPSNNLNPHECPRCWQAFPNIGALLNHEKIHPTTMWYHCRLCGGSFAKRGQLKKHVQFTHSKKRLEITDQNINFKCKECGYESEDYSSHLEHIEKHKFKMVLQHLIERKTDKLCAVCLDKGSLKDLDQMICLHGGSPGLTGDVSLYGILGSTFPNMNNLHSYTGTKICEKCFNSVISSYIFINYINNVRDRLNSCVSLMLDSLKNIEHPNQNVYVEISQKIILSIKDDFDEYLLINDTDEIDESKLKVDVLEDEFRVPDSEDSESDVSDINDKSLVKAKSEYSTEESEVEFAPSCVKNHYYNKRKLCNGYKPKPHNVCNEFLTFKTKQKKRTSSFHCPACDKEFITNYFLQKHIVKHINKKVECLVCGQIFKSKFYLYEHVKISHLQNKDKYYTCDICGRVFVSLNKYKTHTESHFKKQCELCDKLFISQKHFDNHLLRHAIKYKLLKRVKSHYCSFCEKACSSDNDLSLHVNKIHLLIKPYACDMCERQFYTESNMRNHKKLHSLPSKEDCKFCNKTLKSRHELVVHIRKHIEHKPFSCRACSEVFYSENGVKNHLKKVHGGVFSCNVCNNTFRRKNELKKHQQECSILSQVY